MCEYVGVVSVSYVQMYMKVCCMCVICAQVYVDTVCVLFVHMHVCYRYTCVCRCICMLYVGICV